MRPFQPIRNSLSASTNLWRDFGSSEKLKSHHDRQPEFQLDLSHAFPAKNI